MELCETCTKEKKKGVKKNLRSKAGQQIFWRCKLLSFAFYFPSLMWQQTRYRELLYPRVSFYIDKIIIIIIIIIIIQN
jgi:hypothetical protein